MQHHPSAPGGGYAGIASPSIKSPYIRNPNLSTSLRLGMQSAMEPRLPANSTLVAVSSSGSVTYSVPSIGSLNTPPAPASNVALTSPLLVNLLQSDVSGEPYCSSSTASAPPSASVATAHPALSALQTSLSQHNQAVMLQPPPGLKEPITKKAKLKKSRKPKDKPPDPDANGMLVSLASNPSMEASTSAVMPTAALKMSTIDIPHSR